MKKKGTKTPRIPRMLNKKIVVEVEVKSNVDRNFLADNIVGELQEKYNIEKRNATEQTRF